MNEFLRISHNDNVVVALKSLEAGTVLRVDGIEVSLIEDVKAGHKIAITDINKNTNVIKYGYPIGHAIYDIVKGAWVHTHNIKTNLSEKLEYTYSPKFDEIKTIDGPKSFRGFRRDNGEVGVRNELWIVPTVGCVNGIADIIINEFKAEMSPLNIDHVGVFKHNYGCSQLDDDLHNTRKILADLVKHPNAGGVLVLGLGCENNTMDSFREFLGEVDEDRVKFLITQNVEDEVEIGKNLLKEIYEVIKADVREEVPISELKVGLKCGGSDGFSGITANPLIGKFSDYLVANGGTTVLTEVPEMFGAETILMSRAKDVKTFDEVVKLINDFKEYFEQYNQPIYENPSPGNKDGGISTLEEKSLGCTQKGGHSIVSGVLGYGERLKNSGFNLLQAPGNDLVSTTALGSAGCHLVLFSTGRGTPFGSLVPTIKISTNDYIYKKKPRWMDFNAGQLLDEKPMEELSQEFFEYIISVANGELTNNEKNGIHEMAIFKDGVTE